MNTDTCNDRSDALRIAEVAHAAALAAEADLSRQFATMKTAKAPRLQIDRMRVRLGVASSRTTDAWATLCGLRRGQVAA